MNSVKITYLICSLVFDLCMLAAAILIPVYITPGYYWWTAGLFVLLVLSGIGMSQRLDGWREFGGEGQCR